MQFSETESRRSRKPERPIIADEIEAVIKNSLHTKAMDLRVSQENFTKHLRMTSPYTSHTIPKIPRRRMTPKLF